MKLFAMMHRPLRGRIAWTAGLALLVAATEASPAGAHHATWHGGDPAYLSLGLGYFDVLNQDDEAADFRLEYRHDGHILSLFRPWLGIEATSDGSAHLLGGVQLDLRLGDHWQVSGQVGLGPYLEGGGKDLGSVFEIRSQIEVGYRFADRSRLALAFSHTSNASVNERNPGTEVVAVYYHIPVARLFGT